MRFGSARSPAYEDEARDEPDDVRDPDGEHRRDGAAAREGIAHRHQRVVEEDEPADELLRVGCSPSGTPMRAKIRLAIGTVMRW